MLLAERNERIENLLASIPEDILDDSFPSPDDPRFETVSDWEQAVKEYIYATQDVDDDGCFMINDETHCTNF